MQTQDQKDKQLNALRRHLVGATIVSVGASFDDEMLFTLEVKHEVEPITEHVNVYATDLGWWLSYGKPQDLE